MVAVTARPLVGGKRCPFVGEMKRGGERATSQVLDVDEDGVVRLIIIEEDADGLWEEHVTRWRGRHHPVDGSPLVLWRLNLAGFPRSPFAMGRPGSAAR